MRRASHYEELGEEALAACRERSAGHWLGLTSLCGQYAEFLGFEDRR